MNMRGTWVGLSMALLFGAACGGEGLACPEGTTREGDRCVAPTDGGVQEAGSDGCERRAWYLDMDGDGFGDPASERRDCEAPGDGYVTQGGDCDDGCADCFPDNAEVCDGLDNDCSGTADDADSLCEDDGNPCTVDRCGEGTCGVPEHGWHPCGTTRVCGHPASGTPAVCLPMPPLRRAWRGSGTVVDVQPGARLLVRHQVSSTDRRLLVLRLDTASGSLVEEGRAGIDPSADHSGWGNAAALDAAGGDAMLVGSPHVTVSGESNAGWAAVYEREGGSWRPSPLRHGPSLAANRQMGRAVALFGSWAAVALREPNARGSLILFERNGGDWRVRQRVGSDAPEPNARFGTWLRFADENTLLVGEEKADRSGAIHVLERGADGTWNQRQVLTAPLPQPNAGFAQFPRFPSSSRFDRFVVVEPDRDVGPRVDRGAVYVVERAADGSWSVAELAPSSLPPNATIAFGAVRGNWAILVTGGPTWMDPAPLQAHIFRRRAPSNWEEVAVRPVGGSDPPNGWAWPPLLGPDGLVVVGGERVGSGDPSTTEQQLELFEVTETTAGASIEVAGAFASVDGLQFLFPLLWHEGWLLVQGFTSDFFGAELLVSRAGD